MKTKCYPDISTKTYSLTVERLMKATEKSLYKAWTERFDIWFAEPGALMMTPKVDVPFFFKNRKDWGSHPHYGRFTELEQDKLIEMTWITGKGGTEGTETILRIELTPQKQGTFLRLIHSGFMDKESCDAHEREWPEGLNVLDSALESAEI